MSDERNRVTWDGKNTPSETFIALLAHGPWPIAIPASNGVQMDGTLRFTDLNGSIVTARPGDEVEITPRGWILHPKEASDAS